SAILTRADGPIGAAAELVGLSSLRVAWTDPSSAAGHYFPLRYLRRLGVASERLDEQFLGGAPAACAAVAAGQADLCACFVTDVADETPQSVGLHAEAGKDVLRFAEQSHPAPDVAALDLVLAVALEAEAELGIVADLAEEGDRAREKIIGFARVGPGVVEERAA